MGFGGMSIWSLLLILVIVLLLFGTKKLRNIGTDLGGAIKGFKQAVGEGGKDDSPAEGERTTDQVEKRDATTSPDGGHHTTSTQTERDRENQRTHS